MIIQTNLFVCDICGDAVSISEQSSAGDDPVVGVPGGWVSDLDVPEEFRRRHNQSICDACPECRKNPDWECYKAGPF